MSSVDYFNQSVLLIIFLLRLIDYSSVFFSLLSGALFYLILRLTLVLPSNASTNVSSLSVTFRILWGQPRSAFSSGIATLNRDTLVARSMCYLAMATLRLRRRQTSILVFHGCTICTGAQRLCRSFPSIPMPLKTLRLLANRDRP